MTRRLSRMVIGTVTVSLVLLLGPDMVVRALLELSSARDTIAAWQDKMPPKQANDDSPAQKSGAIQIAARSTPEVASDVIQTHELSDLTGDELPAGDPLSQTVEQENVENTDTQKPSISVNANTEEGASGPDNPSSVPALSSDSDPNTTVSKDSHVVPKGDWRVLVKGAEYRGSQKIPATYMSITQWLNALLPECLSFQSESHVPTLLLDCARNHGYAMARVNENLDGYRVLVPGDTFVVNEINVKPNSGAADVGARELARIYGDQSTYLFSARRGQEYAKVLDYRGLLRNPRLDYKISGPGTLSMQIDGEVPENYASFDVNVDYNGDLISTINGRHYLNGKQLGFLRYSFGLNDDGDFSRGYLSAPVRQLPGYEIRFNASRDRDNYFLFEEISSHLGLSAESLNVLEGQGVRINRAEIQWHDQSSDSFFSDNFDRAKDYLRVLLSSTTYREQDRFKTIGLKALLGRVDDYDNMFSRLSVGTELQPVPVYSTDFLFRGRLAGSYFLGNLGNAPFAERIYLGGMNGLRGFEQNSIGTMHRNSSLLGGKASVSGQFEVGKVYSIFSKMTELGAHIDAGRLREPGDWSDTFYSYGLYGRLPTGSKGQLEFSVSHPSVGDDIRAGIIIRRQF